MFYRLDNLHVTALRCMFLLNLNNITLFHTLTEYSMFNLIVITCFVANVYFAINERCIIIITLDVLYSNDHD